MPLPADVVAASDQLTAIYSGALDRVRGQLADAVAAGNRAALERRLTEVSRGLSALLDVVDQQARYWIDHTLPRIYERGMGSWVRTTATALGVAPNDVLSSFAMPSRPAIERIAGGLTDDLLSATRYTRGATKRAVREAVQSGLLTEHVEGSGPARAKSQIVSELESLGIGSVRYANGATVPLDSYAAMALRTTSAIAHNAGITDSGRSNGVEWYEVFDGPDCGWTEHDDDDEADGSIRHVDDVEEFPVAHPNCRRAFGARPDITSEGEAADAEPLGDELEASALEDGTGLPSGPTDAEASQEPVAPSRLDQRLLAREAELGARADARAIDAGFVEEPAFEVKPESYGLDLPPETESAAYSYIGPYRAEARAEAARVLDEARASLDAADVAVLAPPPPRVRHVDPVSGAVEYRRGAGEWDWFDALAPKEQARIKQNFSAGSGVGATQYTPDLVAQRWTNLYGGDPTDIDGIMHQWVERTRVVDAARGLTRGRLPSTLSGLPIDANHVLPETASRFNVDLLFDSSKVTAAKHIAQMRAEEASGFLEREFVDAVHGPPPWEMGEQEWVSEVYDAQARVLRGETAGVDEWGATYTPDAEAALARLAELVPRGFDPWAADIDTAYESIQELAMRAGKVAEQTASPAKPAFTWSDGDVRIALEPPASIAAAGERLAGRLTAQETEAVRSYTAGAYRDLNEALRSGRPLTPEEQHLLDQLDAVIERAGALPEPVVTWRGLDIDRTPLFGGVSDAEAFEAVRVWAVDTFRPGSTVELGGYQSTSLVPNPALDASLSQHSPGVIFEIEATHGAYIQRVTSFDDEYELLLGRDTRYEVVKVLDRVEFDRDIDEIVHRTVVKLRQLPGPS